jgi:F0F1-type ATP synthase alpha subunit
MLLSRAFSTTCKVISAIGIAYNIGPTVTISGLQDNFKINEVCELKTKHGQCKAICTSIYEDHSEFVCFSNKSPIQLNDNVSANAFDLFNTHHNTYSIPTFNSDMQISNKFSKKKYILKKKTPTQCYSGYLGIDILQPIMEGDYVVLNGQANTGKSTVARNAIAMHLKHPNNYAVYCSTEINNCRNLMGIPTYNPSKCLVMHANLSNDSLSSYYSSFKIAESLCNDNKNVLLVLDDTAKLIKHEKEIYLPKSSIVYYKIEYTTNCAERNAVIRII